MNSLRNDLYRTLLRAKLDHSGAGGFLHTDDAGDRPEQMGNAVSVPGLPISERQPVSRK